MFLINRIAHRNQLTSRLGHDPKTDNLGNELPVSRSTTPKPTKKRNKHVRNSVDNLRPAQRYRLDQPLGGNHIRALRVTWRRIKGDDYRKAKTIMYTVTNKFAKHQPILKEIFIKQALVTSLTTERNKTRDDRAHAQLMVEVLDSVIANLDDQPTNSMAIPDDSLTIEHVGSLHVNMSKFGFKASMFEEFGEIFAEEMFKQDVVNAYPGGKRAWGILIARITDQIRHGFDKQTHLNERHT